MSGNDANEHATVLRINSDNGEAKKAAKGFDEKKLAAKLNFFDKSIYCVEHPCNTNHIFCEDCVAFICDKCKNEAHKGHKNTYWVPTSKDNNFIFNYMGVISDDITNRAGKITSNYKEKLEHVEEKTTVFFEDEFEKLDKKIKNFTTILLSSLEKIKLTYITAQKMFSERFSEIKSEFTVYHKDVQNFKTSVDSFLESKGNNSSVKQGNQIFANVKELLNTKKNIDMKHHKLFSFYMLDKNSLSKEFAFEEYNNYLDRNIDFIKNFFKVNDMYINDSNTNITMRIDNATIFNKHLNKGDLASGFSNNIDSYVPPSSSTILQPVERTNIICEYNIDNATFRQIFIRPEIPNYQFSFLKFSRSINFNGRLVTTGGVLVNSLSKEMWIIEDLNKKKSFDDGSPNEVSAITSIENKYEDYKNNFLVYKAEPMIYGHAGHSITSYPPNIIIVISGVDENNKCEMYDIRSNKWDELPSLKTPRIDTTSAIINGYLYVFFGILFNSHLKKASYTDYIERLNLASSRCEMVWEDIIPSSVKDANPNDILLLPRSLCGVLYLDKDQIYIFGGQVGKNKFSDDIFIFNHNLYTIEKSQTKKLFKKTAFIENKFSFNGKKSINFDFNGDIFLYFPKNDNFGFQFQNLS